MTSFGIAAALLLPLLAAGAQAASAATRGAGRLGTTFCHRELGADWAQALDAMDGLGLSMLRVGAYWSDLEPSDGQFDFSSLDAVLDKIESKGRYQVLLTVGMKAPRWPEYYLPAWAAPKTRGGPNDEVSRDPELRRRVLRFVRKTVEHESGRRSIVAWQVENEPMDRSGPNHWFIGADFVREERDAIRQTDPQERPLVVNAWCASQARWSAPWDGDPDYAKNFGLGLGDILGLDVYPRPGSAAPADLEERVHDYPQRYLDKARAEGKDAWIIESQAEPWGPMTVNPSDVRALLQEHEREGYSVVLLWGFEWWYKRLRSGDRSMWDAVAAEAARVQGPAKP